MKYPQLPIASFIAAFLVLVPLPWHWRAQNVATLAMIAWLFVVDIIYGINSLVWAENVVNHAPVWCDITTKIVVGASFALPLASMCICKHLEMVSSSRKVSFDNSDKRRRMIFESIMCFGVPMAFMVLHYIVQGHRFDIIENIGCQATVYISIPAIMIIWFPQLLISVITLVYATLALAHFIRRRISFAAHLQNSNSALTTNRYLRLIAMAVTEIVWGVTFASVNLWNNVTGGLRPWTTWADVHSNFSRVDIFASAMIPPQFFRLMLLFWWTLPASSIIFFIFFGFGEEAKKEYKRVWDWCKKTVFRQTITSKKSGYTISFPTSRNNPHSGPVFQTIELGPPATGDKKSPFPVRSASPQSSSFTATTTMPPTPIKGDAEDDTFTISALSYYQHSPSESFVHNPLTTSPRVFISDAHPPSPASSIPESINDLHLHSTDTENLALYHLRQREFPVPAYHRPFSPPSIVPAISPPALFCEGIQVTIHRQAQVDRIV